MRTILLLLFALNLYSCQAQGKKVSRIDVKLDMAALHAKGAVFGEGRILTADDDFAIGQIGSVGIFLFDLRSGIVLKSIETDLILKRLDEHIHNLIGNQYYVPDIEEYSLKSKYMGDMPYEFRGLLFNDHREKFATQMVTVVFNRRDDMDQLLILTLVFFDKNLDNIEIIPFDPLNMSTNSAWIHGGFFLGQDRMFTKMMAWSHGHDFDFLEYRLTDEPLYELSDTLFGIKINTAGYIGRFHGCFAFQDKN